MGFDDEEDWPQKKPEDSTNNNADEPKNEKLHKDWMANDLDVKNFISKAVYRGQSPI